MRTPSLSQFSLLNLLLALVLVAAFLIRVINLNYNSPFLDEAIYIQVGLKALSGQIDETLESASWVGGLPLFYPVLSASLYSVGGLLLTRFFNVLLGTVCVFLIYHFTKQLMLFKEEGLNKLSGLMASSLIAVLAIPVAISRLANYDALSFTLFLLGIVLLHKAIFSGDRMFYPTSVAVLFLSFLAKYTVAIFFPFIFLMPVFLAVRSRSSDILWGIIQYFCTPFFFLMAFYVFFNFSSLQSFFVNQTVLESTDLSEILNTFLNYTWIIYVISIFSLIIYFDKRRFIVWILFLLSLVPPVTHLLSRNDASIAQHSFLSLIFLAPLASSFFISIYEKFPAKLGIAGFMVFLLFTFIYSSPQIKSLDSFWPNTTEAAKILRQKVSPQDQVLAESDDVVALALKDKLSADQVAGPFNFSYQDKEGADAYVQAINDKYFNFVEIENAYFPDDYISGIEKALSTNYTKIFDDGRVKVYQRV